MISQYYSFLKRNLQSSHISRSCGLMDKASDFGSEDCRFESCHDRYFYFNQGYIELCTYLRLIFFLIMPTSVHNGMWVLFFLPKLFLQKSFDSLTHLDLFNNDICNSDEYRTKVFKLLPNLKYLDDADADDNDEAEEESDVDDVDEGEDGEAGANGAEEEDDDDDDGNDLEIKMI